jgi:hypothetical protein
MIMYILTTIILPFIVAFNVGAIFARGNWSRRLREGWVIGIVAVPLVQALGYLQGISL